MTTKYEQLQGIRTDSGINGVKKMAQILGYEDDVEYMFEDNPYMISALRQAIINWNQTRDGEPIDE